MRIRIKKLDSNARLPEYAHGPKEDAGLDIRSLESTVLIPGVAQGVATGLALEIPSGYEVQIRPRSGLAFSPALPRSATEAMETFDVPLRRLLRVYLANRGVWDAIVGAGPTCSVAASDDDVDAYLAAFADLLGELV